MAAKLHPIIRKLRRNRRLLATAEERVSALLAERHELWLQGRDEGIASNVMAAESGVTPPRVTQIIGVPRAKKKSA